MYNSGFAPDAFSPGWLQRNFGAGDFLEPLTLALLCSSPNFTPFFPIIVKEETISVSQNILISEWTEKSS